MTGLIVLAALVITVVTLLELSHRRHREAFPRTQRGIVDRDVARTRLDLLALAGRAEPFAHRPFTVKGHWRGIGYGDAGQSPVRLVG